MMAAKSKRGEETRLRIIRVATDLFHKQGVQATSPDQVIDASGTGKGQFYHYFKNKQDLVHEVLQSHFEAIRRGDDLLTHTVASWDDLGRWFLVQIEQQKAFNMTRGSLYGTLGNELSGDDELIRLDLSLIYEVLKNRLATFFSTEKARSRLSTDADENQMADFCIATIQGAMLMGKINRDSKPAEAAIREALAHLKHYAVTPA